MYIEEYSKSGAYSGIIEKGGSTFINPLKNIQSVFCTLIILNSVNK